MTLFSLLAIILATYRVTHLVTYEEGPFDACLRLREWTGIRHGDEGEFTEIPERFLPKLFSCLPCLSLWMAGLIYLIWRIEPIPVWILAGSGGAIIIQRFRE